MPRWRTGRVRGGGVAVAVAVAVAVGFGVEVGGTRVAVGRGVAVAVAVATARTGGAGGSERVGAGLAWGNEAVGVAGGTTLAPSEVGSATGVPGAVGGVAIAVVESLAAGSLALGVTGLGVAALGVAVLGLVLPGAGGGAGGGVVGAAGLVATGGAGVGSSSVPPQAATARRRQSAQLASTARRRARVQSRSMESPSPWAAVRAETVGGRPRRVGLAVADPSVASYGDDRLSASATLAWGDGTPLGEEWMAPGWWRGPWLTEGRLAARVALNRKSGTALIGTSRGRNARQSELGVVGAQCRGGHRMDPGVVPRTARSRTVIVPSRRHRFLPR